ncbi:putative toxin, partial [Streptomyces sp. NPDC087218]|uniref:putative toxin n=1 Tax=Streptomyces sp. NPDC087218 TaxID=3365769 RepID=UPI0037F39768
ASLLGIGNLANKVKSVFHAVAKPVNRAIDKIINLITKKGKALWNKLKGKDKNGKDGKGNDKKPGGPETPQQNKRAALADADTMLSARPTREQATSKLPAISQKHRIPLRLVVESTGAQGEKVHVQAMASGSHTLPVRPVEIKLLKTPYLDRLEKLQPGASQRYVDDFKNVYAGAQTLLRYVEGRAARKLGRVKEQPGIDAYNAKSGMGVTKNNNTIEILDAKKKKVERERIPDFFLDTKVVGDIKNVKDQSYDEQMRDNSRIAKGTRVRLRGETKLLAAANRFDLVVRAPSDDHPDGTHVSAPLKEAIADNGGEIYELL